MTWAAEGLRTLALAYKDVNNIEEINQQEDPDSDLIFIALVAIKDPIRKEIPKAVKDCQHAGLFVRMVTGDNILTATKIAKECGIFYGDGVALEGAAFRNMSEEERIKILPQLQVLARCSPNDKFELVSLLRQQGEVVAVTGDGTNDAPALKNADIGFSMGISGTQIALNASDIVLLDDNFTSIVQAIRWGRNVLNTIQKFLQFQLGINLAAIIITFAGAVFVGKSPFSTVQLLWVNLIMDSFGALALASDDPDDDILDKPPHHRKDSIFSYFMLEYIFTQTIYQVTTLLVILFNIDTFVPASTNTHSTQDLIGYPSKRARTIVFTTFICILAIILLIQIVAVTVGSTLFNASSLDITEWIVCIIISLFNLPIVFLARMGSKIYHVTAARQKYGRVGDAKVLNGVTPSKQVDTIDGKKQYDRVAYVEHIDKTAEDLDLLDYSESPLRGEVDLERGLATRPLKTNQGKQRLSDKTTNNGKSVSSQNNENVEVMHSIHVNAPLSTKSRSVASSISVISTGSQEL
ncbi:calcium-translocating P-type ATPase, PMCA-type [Batrachochytrium salamandrivorans]|nr:calcium-translocating P-type ATPase, PMCA-type [Batrachochytrium salamandrivorans]